MIPSLPLLNFVLLCKCNACMYVCVCMIFIIPRENQLFIYELYLCLRFVFSEMNLRYFLFTIIVVHNH